MLHQMYFLIGFCLFFLQRLSGSEPVGTKPKMVSTVDFGHDVTLPAAIPTSRLTKEGKKIVSSPSAIKTVHNQILPTNSEKKMVGSSGTSSSTSTTTSSTSLPQPSTTTTSQPSTISQSTATQLSLHWFPDPIDDPFYTTAVCNDGSPGGYYYSSPSVAEANDTFVIHLPGGGQCYDEMSCQARWEYKKNSMTSTLFPAYKVKKGFMDSSMKKTPFWGANKAMLGYCSSDGYMGDVGNSTETWGWHFRGQQLVFGLIRQLIKYHGLSSKSTIIFSGGSAGARGVMVLIDLLVKEHFPKGAKVIGFLDSPYYIDIPPYTPNYRGFQYEEQQKYKYMNTHNIISEECAARYPSSPVIPSAGTPAEVTPSAITPTEVMDVPESLNNNNTTTIPFVNEQWKCQFGQYRLPFVQTSFFMVTSQYDSYQLQMDLGQVAPPPFKTPGETLYAEQFATSMQHQMNELKEFKTKERWHIIPETTKTAGPASASAAAGTTVSVGVSTTSASISTNAAAAAAASSTTTTAVKPIYHPVTAMTYGLYSWSCYNHDVSSSSAFYTMTVDEGVTMKDALESFIKDALKQQNKQQKKQRQLLAMAAAGGEEGAAVGGGAEMSTTTTTNGGAGRVGSGNTLTIGTDVTGTSTVTATTTTDKGVGGSGGAGAGDIAIPPYLRTYVNVVHSWMDTCQGLGCGQGCALSKTTTPTSIPVALLVAMKQRQIAMMELIDAPGSYSGNLYPHLHQQGVGVDKDLVNKMYNAESASEEQDQDPEEDVGVSLVQVRSVQPIPVTSVKQTTETTKERMVKGEVQSVDEQPLVQSQPQPQETQSQQEEEPQQKEEPHVQPSQPSQESEQPSQPSQPEELPQGDSSTDEHDQLSPSPPLPSEAMRNSRSNTTVFSSPHSPPPTPPSEHERSLHTITVPSSVSLPASSSLPASTSHSVTIPVSVLSHDVAMVGLSGGVEEHCR